MFRVMELRIQRRRIDVLRNEDKKDKNLKMLNKCFPGWKIGPQETETANIT